MSEHEFPSGLVSISGRSGQSVGAGFFADEKHILSCAHVVESALGLAQGSLRSAPPDHLRAVGLTAPFEAIDCTVKHWLPVNSDPKSIEPEDVAVLEISSEFKSGRRPIVLRAAPVMLDERLACYNVVETERNWTHWIAAGWRPGGWIQLGTDPARPGPLIRPGCSGGPLMDLHTGEAVGLMVSGRADGTASWCIPISILERAWPELVSHDPDKERSFRESILRAKNLIVKSEGSSETDIQRLIAALSGAGVPDSQTLLKEASAVLLEKERDTRSRSRKELVAMQTITKLIVSPEDVRREVDAWERYKTKYEGSFRATVQKATGAMILFRSSLLNALKLRGADIHENLLSGYCRSVFEDAERFAFMRPRESDYAIENCFRILTSLMGIWKCDPNNTFPDPVIGIASSMPLENCLVVARKSRLEIRPVTDPRGVQALLLMDSHCSRPESHHYRNRKIVSSYTREAVHIWDPSISTPIGTFAVPGPYGISDVVHRNDGERLISIVATTDGPVFDLLDLQPVRESRPLPKGFWDNVAMLPNGKVFALLSDGYLRVVTRTDSGYPEVLNESSLASQLSRIPILKEHWAERMAGREEQGLDFESSFQHPGINCFATDHHNLLRLDFQLSSRVWDSLLLFLDPNHNPLRVVGYFLEKDHIVCGYDVIEEKDGALLLAAALLQSRNPHPCLKWAGSAMTTSGIMFAGRGEALPDKGDLIRIAMAGSDTCFVSDDKGGLFQVSLSNGVWTEVGRDEDSRITGLCYIPPAISH
jgi:hypothetical protein